MGEDPIIVKPGKYPGAEDGDDERVGICLVIDDDSWTITEGADGITITIPSDSRWKVVKDITTPSPDDPSAPVKRKVALLRENGTLAGVNNPVNGDITISFTVPPPAPNPTLPS